MSKLPTAEETTRELIDSFSDAIGSYISISPKSRHDISAIVESHTVAHTAALRERVKELEVKQSTLTSAMHESLTQLIQCDYVKANMLIYDALKIADEL